MCYHKSHNEFHCLPSWDSTALSGLCSFSPPHASDTATASPSHTDGKRKRAQHTRGLSQSCVWQWVVKGVQSISLKLSTDAFQFDSDQCMEICRSTLASMRNGESMLPWTNKHYKTSSAFVQSQLSTALCILWGDSQLCSTS